METSPQLVLVGSIAIDRIMNFDGRYQDLIKPDKLHVLSLSVLIDRLVDTPGGVAANIAYTLALLGERPTLVGAVGPDANDYIHRLQELGIDTTGVYRSQRPTATFTVMTDAADNQVGGFYPGAMADNQHIHLDGWQDRPALVVITPNDPAAMRQQVSECQKYGLRLLYDVGQQANNLDPADIRVGIQAAELLIANDYEMAVLCEKTGWTMDELRHLVPILITTLGEQGAVIEGKQISAPIKITSATPTKVVDPTGAGDAFRAGFLYGYVRQYNLQVCGQMGAVAAVYAVENQGTQTHTFTRAEFIERYQQTYGETLKL